MKAVLQYRASPGFVAQLTTTAPPWLDIAVIDETDKAGFAAAMRDTVVLLHVLEPVTAEVIGGAPELRLVQKIGVGVNTIDLDAARAHGVGVANMPGTNAQSVVELALALMLAAMRCVVTVDRETRAGRGWQLDPGLVDDLGEIGGSTVGLVGYGAIGRGLAKVLSALGARVVYTTLRPGPADTAVEATRLEFSDLLAQSDVISLHVPLTPTTANLIDATSITAMKDGVIIVNTARGGLVDEVALVEALRSGKVRAAGLDVFATEPLDPSNPLLTLDNVVVSPHVAWLTPQTLARSMRVAFENCRRVRDGEPLEHEIVPYLRA